MTNEHVQQFINDLKKVLDLFPDYQFVPVSGATIEEIESLEKIVGVRFDDTLKSLWAFSNGSKNDSWFGVHSDQDTPCDFLAIKDALKLWREWNGLGEKWGSHGMPDNHKRDSRIQRDWNPKWFPIGEFNGGSTMILFDSAPTPLGAYGQIIVYQHDPDAVYYVAENAAAFFVQSPRILQNCLQELQDI